MAADLQSQLQAAPADRYTVERAPDGGALRRAAVAGLSLESHLGVSTLLLNKVRNGPAATPAQPNGSMVPPDRGAAGEPHRITDLLLQLRGDRTEAMDQLFPLVYEELRQIAHRQLAHERPGHTLETSALVHETYLKLVDQTRVEWRDRAHFFRVAAWAMRRILVDYARKYRALRRGGGRQPVTLDEEEAGLAERGETLLALNDALDRLAKLNQRLSQVVECRYFGGLTEEETAEALGVTARTVQRDWAKARGWLYLELRG